jgi:hypothetical protein
LILDDMLNYQRIRSGSMKNPAPMLRRQIAIALVAFLAVPFGGSLPVHAQQTAPSQPVGGMPPPPAPSQNSDTTNQNPAAGASQGASGNSSSNLPNSPQEQQSGPPAPVGTAVAPYEKGIGVAASRPAGAVIAPAKQKRSRSFMIKVGVLIGAAVAIGTVVGLSAASPSQPNK